MIHTIFRDDEVIVAVNGVPYTVDIDDSRYELVCEAIDDEDEETLKDLLSLKGRASKLNSKLADYGIDAYGGDYTYKGNPIAMDLNDYLHSAIESGSFEPVVNFISRLYQNPSNDTRERLFAFMEKNKMPIDKDGRFLAFKVVDKNYLDKYTHSIDNSVGTTVPMMSWAEVDTNPANTCSRGYHACSKDYIVGEDAFYFNESVDRVVSVAIAPEDVGSIPDDYNGSKLRCRQYTVLADITDQLIAEHQNVRIHMKEEGIDPYRTETVVSYKDRW